MLFIRSRINRNRKLYKHDKKHIVRDFSSFLGLTLGEAKDSWDLDFGDLGELLFGLGGLHSVFLIDLEDFVTHLGPDSLLDFLVHGELGSRRLLKDGLGSRSLLGLLHLPRSTEGTEAIKWEFIDLVVRHLGLELLVGGFGHF